MSQLLYDRVPSDALLQQLRAGAPAGLLTRRRAAPRELDVQFRHDPKSGTSWATLYAGLTSLIDLRERKGLFRLTSSPTYQGLAPFDPAWSSWRDSDELNRSWPEVESYLDQLRPRVPARYTEREGKVQTATTSGDSPDYWAIDREAQPHFPSVPEQVAVLRSFSDPLLAALAAAGRQDAWWPGVRDRGKAPVAGPGLDLLAVDRSGRLLAVELKDAGNLKGMVFGPVQVRVYAELVTRWLEQDPAKAVDTLNRMLTIRSELGLSPTGPPVLAPDVVVVPVLGIGAGRRSPQLLSRLADTAGVVEAAPRAARIQPLETWSLDAAGVASPLLAENVGPST